jgi:phenylpropionate dioxygenase-like ring-hydroxylating dioxygenase large terminal subunit
MNANYPLDCWYVIAASDEVGRTPLGRRVLDRPVVLYREESGDVVALSDRCAHRAYPLSKGRLEGDLLVCGYHGLRYDSTGECVHVPSQPNVPYDACVHSYEVREEPPFVWIWPGDARRSVLRPVAQLPWLRSDDWRTAPGAALHVAANYTLLHEHLVDVTHIAQVHSQETPPGYDEMPPLEDVRVSETSVSYSRSLPAAMLAEWEAEATGLPRDRAYERRHHGTFLSPAMIVEGWDIDDGEGRLHQLVRIHAMTPESPTSTHLFWQIAHNYDLNRTLVGEHVRAVMEAILHRDVELVETIEATAGHEEAASGINIRADAAVLRVRRIVDDMVAAETGRTSRFSSGRKTA